VPASSAELAANECLVPYPGTNVDPEIAQRCYPGAECAAVLCAPQAPPSRIAQMIGSGCSYADECLGQLDECVIATNIGTCCPCPTSMPASLVEADPCLVAEGEEIPADAKCPVCNTLIACNECPEPGEASCVIQDSWSECR
jgi:hypothetical protein